MELPTTPCMKAVKEGRAFGEEAMSKHTISLFGKQSGSRIMQRSQLSWWDSAALGIVASSADSGIRVMARGRNHARQELKDIQSWRDAEIDKFVASPTRRPPPPPPISVPMDVSQPVCHSPCHFSRKYGKEPYLSPRACLRPLQHDKLYNGTIKCDAAPPRKGREKANAEARAACWRTSAARENPHVLKDATTRGFDATAVAAAV